MSPHAPLDQRCFLSIQGSCLKWRWEGQRPRRKPHCQSFWPEKTDWAQRGTEFTKLLHFLHVAYIMGGEEVPYQTPRRCPKSWQVCCGHLCGQWLGNEAMYQTRRPGCLALTLVKGGATEASVGVGFCNSFEHPRESEKLRKACQNFLRIFVCIWQR